MSSVNLGAVDLNLLHALCTVLEEGSATRAAHKLHVTQSAVSNALRRARELFGDPLLVRRAHGLSATPRAQALLPELRAWLEQARRLLSDAPVFEAKRSTRTFRVACADAVAVTLLQPLLRSLGQQAPNASLRLVTLDRLIAEDGLARGEVDLLVGMPPVLPPHHGAELVYRDPLTCIVRKSHPAARRRLTLDVFAALPHVELALFDRVDDSVDRALSRHGRARNVKVALPHFSTVPLAVLETDCVATLSSRIARAFAARMPLTLLKPPLELPPIEIQQVWHERNEHDPAVSFLRGLVREAARVGAPRSK
ncbi:MAG: LysR family transcriptional regulator [Polyangiaceae bacterium]